MAPMVGALFIAFSDTYWTNAVVMVLSTAAYVYRAALEERFLCQSEAYRAYMKKVAYRFIPGVY